MGEEGGPGVEERLGYPFGSNEYFDDNMFAMKLFGQKAERERAEGGEGLFQREGKLQKGDNKANLKRLVYPQI
ncbi:unnamed protein product [Prunus armeniaca]